VRPFGRDCISTRAQRACGKPADRLWQRPDGGKGRPLDNELNIRTQGEVMQRKHKIRGAALALAALAALAVTSAAPAQGTSTITIRHQTRGCHSWSFNSGPFKASQSITVKAGTVLRFTNNDVMPHKLIQAAGPKMRLAHPNMIKMASSATVKLTQKGTYRFTTKPGEDYAWAGSMKTSGEDNVLRLTVRVK
jgi:plastocyanin